MDKREFEKDLAEINELLELKKEIDREEKNESTTKKDVKEEMSKPHKYSDMEARVEACRNDYRFMLKHIEFRKRIEENYEKDEEERRARKLAKWDRDYERRRRKELAVEESEPERKKAKKKKIKKN